MFARFFSAAFSPDPRLPIVRLHRFAFLELLEALGLVDRRRVASNVAAVDFAFDRCASLDPFAGRLAGDAPAAPAPDPAQPEGADALEQLGGAVLAAGAAPKTSLARSEFVAAVVLSRAELVHPTSMGASSNGDSFIGFRELDESTRSVQTSAETTSMSPSSSVSKFGRDVPNRRSMSAQVLYVARLLRDDISAPAPEAKAAPQPADRPRLPPATGPARRRRSSNLTPAMLLGLDAPAAADAPRAGGGGDRGVLFPKVLASVLEGAFARLHKARPRALLDPDTFRRHALYSPEVDVALKPHARPLSELYSAYKDGPDHASVLMGVDGWLRLLHGAGLLRGDARPRHDLPRDDEFDDRPGKPRFTDRPERPYEGDLTEADARCCFAYAQVQTGGDDGGKEKGRRKNTDEFITRIDFVEALCWLALMKPLPSARALTHAWEPGTSLEDFVEVLDEPDVINSPDLHHFIDMPKPLPQTPRDAAWLSLESLVIKMLFVVYRRVARANPALEHVCLSIGQPTCERQLEALVAAGLG